MESSLLLTFYQCISLFFCFAGEVGNLAEEYSLAECEKVQRVRAHHLFSVERSAPVNTRNRFNLGTCTLC